VAKGVSSCLPDEQCTQSLFKQKILGACVMPFATMSGSKVADWRMVALDGSAGSPASVALISKVSLNTSQAVIESVPVEMKRSDVAPLDSPATDCCTHRARFEALPGEAVEHLPRAVEQVAGVSLFMFLDPCGAGDLCTDLVAVLAGPRREVWPVTEVLLTFSADLIRRAAGAFEANPRTCRDGDDDSAAWADDHLRADPPAGRRLTRGSADGQLLHDEAS
jgi:hypothetical protein